MYVIRTYICARMFVVATGEVRKSLSPYLRMCVCLVGGYVPVRVRTKGYIAASMCLPAG